MKKGRVLAAMSGGVDSSVAAALLREDNYDVVGITMQLWPSDREADEAARFGGCCSIEAVSDAKKVAFKIGIPHYVLNFRKIFEEKVIKSFCREYMAGRTPNPCVRCNQYIKFEVLLQKAKELNADFIATGHYARIGQNRGRYFLKKGKDAQKDQSYFLYMMNQDHLASTLMPLGDFTKRETREMAKTRGLNVAEKKESQEICFVLEGDYGNFVKTYLNESSKPGPILNLKGDEIGEHRGLIFYTIGQRRGLGLANEAPLYVIEIDKEKNSLIVGPEEKSYASRLTADEVSFVNGPYQQSARLRVKIRYHAEEIESSVSLTGSGRVLVEFDQPQRAVTPGQAVVFYDGDTVVGGGTISKFERM